MNYLDYFKNGGTIETFESDTIPLIRHLSNKKLVIQQFLDHLTEKDYSVQLIR